MSRRTSGPLVPLALLAVSLLCLFLIVHSRRTSRAQTGQEDSAPCCGPDSSIAPRELDFPCYSLRDGFSSVLNLVSDSPSPIDLSIVIHGRMGQTVLTQTSIQPQQKLELDLRQTLTNLGADTYGAFAEGSVSVYFEGTIMPVVGQVTMTNAALKLVHESEMVENDPGRSDIPPVLDGLWWNLSGGRDASVMVSNMSADTATADVYLDFQGQRHTGTPLVFSAHETKVVSVTKLLSDLGTSASEAPEGGITIMARGTNPTLIAQGRVLDPVTGFSTTLEFPDPGRQNVSALHASGLPIGTPPNGSPYAGTGTFTPHVVVRNLLPSAQNVTITVEYPTGKYQVQGPGPQAEKRGKREFDGETGEGTETLPLGPFTIAGFATQDISFDAALSQLPLPVPYCSIRIQYSDAPGTLVAQVSSVDAKQDLVVDAHMANEGDGWAGSGANPWHLDDQTESILFLTNASDKPARVGLSVTVNDLHYYLTSLKLDSHETRAINLRKLRDAQMADFQQNKIPATATDGSVNWIRLDNVAVTGRVMAISRQSGLASSYDCNPCRCPPTFISTTVSQDPANSPPIVPGQTCQHTATGNSQDCNGFWFPTDATDLSTWSSSATGVATVNTTGLVTGVSGGTTTVSAVYCDSKYLWNVVEGACTESTLCRTGSASCPVVSVSGLDTVWWFNGQMPAGYNTTITLTALPSGATSYSWSVAAGGNRVTLNGQSGNTINVTGSALSAASGDVMIKVQVQTSTWTGTAPKNMTVRGPYKLVPGYAQGGLPAYQDYPESATTGYETHANYTIEDNLSAPLTIPVPLNEYWTTPLNYNSPYNSSNCTWVQAAAGSLTTTSQNPAAFYDKIAGPMLSTNPIPPPIIPQNPLTGTAVVNWGQKFFVGSPTNGAGLPAQTDLLQYYIDHGRHLSIVSPVP